MENICVISTMRRHGAELNHATILSISYGCVGVHTDVHIGW